MKEHPHEEHRKRGPRHIGFAFITISTSRALAVKRGETPLPDESYRIARELVEKNGHRASAYRLVADDPLEIVNALADLLRREDVDIVVTMGGTGPAPSDVTVATLRPLFEKELEGFGCIFRMLSYGEIGSAAFLSNATAGIVGGKVVFVLPGSPGAARLALEKIILPEAGHILGLIR